MKTILSTRSGWLAARSSDRSAPRDSDTNTARSRGGRVHHRQRVGGELLLAVGVGLGRAVRAPVAAPVERDHSAVAREVRDLHLPVPRVDDRPRRHEEHRGLARAVDLVVEVDAVAFDVARRVRDTAPASARLRGLQLDRHARFSSQFVDPLEQLPVAGLDSRKPLEHDSLVEGDDQRDERFERHLDPVVLAWRGEGLCQNRPPLGVHPVDALLQLGPVPGERLELVPDLLVGSVFAHHVAHRRPPLLEEGHVGGVHLALPRDLPLGEAFEHPHEQVLDRAEVVVDEAVVDARLLGQTPRRDARVAGVDEHALGRVEESLLGGRARGRDLRNHQRRLSRSTRLLSRARQTRSSIDTALPPPATRVGMRSSPMWCARITGRSPSCSRRPGAAPRAPGLVHRAGRAGRGRSRGRPPCRRWDRSSRAAATT